MYNPIPLKSNKFALKSTTKSENEISIHLIIYIHDLDYIALGDYHGNVLIYRVRGMKLIKKFSVHKIKVESFVYLCNGKNIISGDSDGKLILYSVVEPFDHIIILENLDSINEIVYCMDAHSIYVACNNKILKVNFLNKRIICTIEGHTNEITRLIYHVKHKYLYSCCKSGIIICWDTDSNTEIRRIEDASIISDSILDMTVFPNLHSSQNQLTLQRYYSKIKNFINVKTGLDELLIVLSEIDNGQKSNILIFRNSDFSLIKKIENYRNYSKLISTYEGDTIILPVKNSRDNSAIFITKNLCNEIEKERSSNYNSNKRVEYLNGSYLGDGSRLIMVTSTGSIELWITI